MKQKRVNKYLYGWKFFCNYGQGWEYEHFDCTRDKMKTNRKAYRENSQYPLKISRGRELNPDWKAAAQTHYRAER